MTLTDIEKITKALADINRLKIIKHMQHNNGTIACQTICSVLHLTQPSVSHHIKKLVESDVILAVKDGRNYHYTLNTNLLTAYNKALQKL